jgi:hypothetical protein
MSFTVVPLHNLELESGTRAEFGDGFIFQDVPEWLKNEPILKDISRHDRQGVADARHALVAEYEAAAIGTPDPSWKGKNPKSFQELKFQSAILAARIGGLDGRNRVESGCDPTLDVGGGERARHGLRHLAG